MTEWITKRMPGPPAIAFDEMGEGPPVVFLHGVGGNRTNWHPQLPVFAARFRAVAWDSRGYGDSDDYDGPLDFREFAHDLARLLDHLGVVRAHIVGNSMGGRIAQDFYEAYPLRVATLVLYDTFSGHEPGRSPAERKDYLEIRKKPLLEGKLPADIAPLVARNVVSPNCMPAAYEMMVRSIAALHRDSYLKTLDAMINYPRKTELEKIDVPVLLLYGADDTLTPPAFGRAMAARIRHAEFVEVSGAGHMVNVEMPHRFNEIVLDFLNRYRFRAF